MTAVHRRKKLIIRLRAAWNYEARVNFEQATNSRCFHVMAIVVQAIVLHHVKQIMWPD